MGTGRLIMIILYLFTVQLARLGHRDDDDGLNWRTMALGSTETILKLYNYYSNNQASAHLQTD